MKYKVIEEYGIFKKGDMLEWNEEANAFTLDVKEDNCYRSAMIDDITAEVLSEDGVLEYIEDRSDSNRVNDTVELIDTLVDQYTLDYKDMIKVANEGKLPPCMKVEAETVYCNMVKVLNKIKEELTHE